jgi:hypothetical protein
MVRTSRGSLDIDKGGRFEMSVADQAIMAFYGDVFAILRNLASMEWGDVKRRAVFELGSVPKP